ncbi:MAG: hypothetical protein ACRD9W_12340, partial [Terriglobia bacterium]
ADQNDRAGLQIEEYRQIAHLELACPVFGSPGIIFYTIDIQWQQREIFSSFVLTRHGIFTSGRHVPKMHLLDGAAMNAARDPTPIRQASSMPKRAE